MTNHQANWPSSPQDKLSQRQWQGSGGRKQDNTRQENEKRTTFVINYTLTIFAVATLLITALSTLHAQESAPPVGGQAVGGAAHVKKSEASSSASDTSDGQEQQVKGFDGGSLPLGVPKNQPAAGSVAASAKAPTKGPSSTSRSTVSGEQLTRSTRQTRATTKKHSTTTPSSDEDVTTAAMESTPKPQTPLDSSDSDTEPVSGKVGVVRPKSTKKSKNKQRRQEEETADDEEDVDEEEERERERDRARRRKLRNRHRTSTTTTSTTTRAPSTPTGLAAGNSTTAAVVPTAANNATKNVAQQPQNGSVPVPSQIDVGPLAQKPPQPTVVGDPKMPSPANTTGVASRVPDSSKPKTGLHLNNSSAIDASQRLGDQATAIAEPVVGNRSLSDLVRDAINDHNNAKGLNEALKHFKLTCSVSAAPLISNLELGPSSSTVALPNSNSKNHTLPQAYSNHTSPLVTNGQNNSSLMHTNSSTGPALQSVDMKNMSHPHHGHNTTGTSLHTGPTTTTTRPLINGSVLLPPNHNNITSLPELANSTMQRPHSHSHHTERGIGGNNNNNTSSEHERLEDHVKEQAQALRHFIVICSVSVVLATSLAVALITLLLK